MEEFMIKLGRYDVPWTGDPDVFVRFYRDAGYKAIYAPPLKPGDTELIRATREAAAQAGQLVGEAGAWRNLVAHDEETPKADLQIAVDTLAVADELGAVACVAYHGTVG